MQQSKPPEENSGEQKNYHSWLLRMWREQSSSPWRFQLKEVESKQVMLFDNLPALHNFLGEVGEQEDL